MQRFVRKFLKKTSSSCCRGILARLHSFVRQTRQQLPIRSPARFERNPSTQNCLSTSLCCFYFECSTLYFLASFPHSTTWRSPPRIFPPSRSFTPLCHHPGAESCTNLLNTGLSVCTRYTSCCTSFKRIYYFFYTDLPSQTSPVPTSACRRKRCRVAALLVTHGTGYVVPIASH